MDFNIRQVYDFERERREKDKIIKELKSEVSNLKTIVENLQNQQDPQEQFSSRNWYH